MIRIGYCQYLFERFFEDSETGKRWFVGDQGIQEAYDAFMAQTDPATTYWKEQLYARIALEHERLI